MNKLVLFKNNFNVIKKLDPIEANQLGRDLFLKNASLSTISKLKDLSSVFSQITPFIEKEHRYLSFDVKLKNVIKGKCPSIYGWHCDGKNINSWNQPVQDRYLLLVNDENCLTEFLTEPVSLYVNDSYDVIKQMKYFQEQISSQKVKKTKIEPWTLVEYSNDTFHTVTEPLKNHRRLLIRVNESDYLKPRMNSLDLENDNG